VGGEHTCESRVLILLAVAGYMVMQVLLDVRHANEVVEARVVTQSPAPFTRFGITSGESTLRRATESIEQVFCEHAVLSTAVRYFSRGRGSPAEGNEVN
jgi:hypothetical protein